MNSEKMASLVIVLIVVIIVLIMPLTWIFQSYMEAKSYNNVTGQHVSTWDAMWIELRVQAGPVSNEGSK